MSPAKATMASPRVALFDYPFGIAVDNAGNIWVAPTPAARTIRAVTPAGVVTTIAGLASATPGGAVGGAGSVSRFNNPASIAVDGMDNLYIADTYNSTVREVTAAGVVLTLSGLAGNTGSVRCPRAAAPASSFPLASPSTEPAISTSPTPTMRRFARPPPIAGPNGAGHSSPSRSAHRRSTSARPWF